MKRDLLMAGLLAVLLAFESRASPQGVRVELPERGRAGGVQVRRHGERLIASWPMAGGEFGELALDLRPGKPVIESLGLADRAGGTGTPVLRGVEPVTWMTVGTREAPAGRPPGMSIWNTFFDGPASRPHQTYRSQLELKRARVTREGNRATIALGDL